MVNYKLAARAIKLAIDEAKKKARLPLDCDPNTDEPHLDGAKNKYNCGEIPYGDIVGGNQKHLFDIDIDRTRGEENKVEYDVNGFKVKVFATRNQRSGKARIKDFDRPNSREFNTSKRLFDSSFVQFKPGNNKLATSVCTFVPGFEVYTNRIKTKGDFRRKIIWGLTSLKGKGELDMDAGRASFDYAKLCGAFQIQVNAETFRPEVKVIGFEVPEFKNLKHTGMKTKVKVDASGLLKFANYFTRVFGFDIEKRLAREATEEIESTVKSEFKKITQEEVKSGVWLKRVMEEEFVNEKMKKNLEQEVTKSLRQGGPGDPLNFASRLEAACIVAGEKLSGRDYIQNAFVNLCRNSFVLEADIFMEDPTSKSMGCYDNFVNPLLVDQGNRSWPKDCEISNRVTLTLPKVLAPLYDCISELDRNGNLENIADSCGPEIDYIEDKIRTSPDIQVLVDRAEEILKSYDTEENRQRIERIETILRDFDLDEVIEELESTELSTRSF